MSKFKVLGVDCVRHERYDGFVLTMHRESDDVMIQVSINDVTFSRNVIEFTFCDCSESNGQYLLSDRPPFTNKVKVLDFIPEQTALSGKANVGTVSSTGDITFNMADVSQVDWLVAIAEYFSGNVMDPPIVDTDCPSRFLSLAYDGIKVDGFINCMAEASANDITDLLNSQRDGANYRMIICTRNEINKFLNSHSLKWDDLIVVTWFGTETYSIGPTDLDIIKAMVDQAF